jgi:hypothetical protein
MQIANKLGNLKKKILGTIETDRPAYVPRAELRVPYSEFQ